MLEDKLLIWKFKRGNTDALGRIYDKYENDLLTLAANLSGDLNLAEDVVQEVFITFAESINKFNLTGSLKNYLAVCTANKARDFLRKRQRQQNLAANQTEQRQTESDSPIQLVMQTEELEKLRDAMTHIPYEQREVVVLHLHGGLKFRQIAKL